MADLRIEPADALIDVPRRITVSGLRPGERVTLRSQTLRGPGVRWGTSARFAADVQGVIDLLRDAPLEGGSAWDQGYRKVSAMGLVWAQTPELAGDAATAWASRDVFGATPHAALETRIEVWREQSGQRDRPLASALLVQRLAGEGVTRCEVREEVDGEHLVGTLFTPAGPGPHPAVLVLNGSGGGINEPRAALYASQGYAALALGYFKAPGRSDYISNTRLEYFEAALAWMHARLQPAKGFVALSGQSRGGELVLLLASLLPTQVAAVVGYVPGAVVHCAQNACDPALGREGPAWLWRGEPLVDVWRGNRTASWAPWDEGPEPRRHTHAILTALDDPDAVARARIPVERIRGPVLLLSATDDGSWPSSRYSRMVTDRLAAHHHAWPVGHVDVQGGGHAINIPFVPTTHLVYAHPVSGRLSTTGGTPAANAQGDADTWAAVKAFLAAAVAARPTSSDKDNA